MEGLKIITGLKEIDELLSQGFEKNKTHFFIAKREQYNPFQNHFKWVKHYESKKN